GGRGAAGGGCRARRGAGPAGPAGGVSPAGARFAPPWLGSPPIKAGAYRMVVCRSIGVAQGAELFEQRGIAASVGRRRWRGAHEVVERVSEPWSLPGVGGQRGMLARIGAEVVQLRALARGGEDELPAATPHGDQIDARTVVGETVRLAERGPLWTVHEHAASREVRWGREAEELGERREEIDPLDLVGAPSGRDPRPGDDQRHVKQLVVEVCPVQQQAVLLELLAVVGDDDDHGRVTHPEALESAEERGQLGVPATDLAIVEGAQVGDLVGWQGRAGPRVGLA